MAYAIVIAGRFFEVTPAGAVVWEYHNPFSGDAPNPAGDPPRSVFRATHIPPEHPALQGRVVEVEPQGRVGTARTFAAQSVVARCVPGGKGGASSTPRLSVPSSDSPTQAPARGSYQLQR